MSYEDLTKDQIAERIRDEHGVDPAPYNTIKKDEMIRMLESLDAEAMARSELLDDVEEEDDDIVAGLSDEDLEKLEIEVAPHIFSDKWAEFIMGQFEEDELVGDAPKCVGLSRLVQKWIGPIIRCGIASHTPPTTENKGTATVVYQVEVFVTNQDHPAYGLGEGTLFYEDIADVNQDNTDFPYCKHQSATAATRAESRIYRKMLNLRHIIAAEEVAEVAEEDGDIEWVTDESITDDQMSVINLICSRLNLNVMEFMNSGKNTYAVVQQIPKRVATKMIKELNRLQQGEKAKPQHVSSYDPNWREG